MKDQYFVCDSRYGFGQDFKDSMIVLLDTAKECCKAVNEQTYGGSCVVVEPASLEIMWEWNHTDKWEPIK